MNFLPVLQEAAARRFEKGLQSVSVEMQANELAQQNVGTLALKRGFALESETGRGDRVVHGAALEKRSPR